MKELLKIFLGRRIIKKKVFIKLHLRESDIPNEQGTVDYRQGIPFKLQQKLKSEGWEMDTAAVLVSAPYDSYIELYDVQTGDVGTFYKSYESAEDRSDYSKDVYTCVKGSVPEFCYGDSVKLTAGSIPRMMHGVVAREC